MANTKRDLAQRTKLRLRRNRKLRLSAVIPVYNEEQSLGKVIPEISKELKKSSLNKYEVITVNDGSTDNSQAILNRLKKTKNINKIVSHKTNKGYGAALKTGIKLAKYPYVLIIDADGTYPPRSIPKIISEIKSCDMVIGSREKKGNAVPVERRPAKLFLNKFASYIAGINIPDLNSGFRVFNREIVEKYWELFPERFSFTSTLTMIFISHMKTVRFVPIDYYPRFGKSSVRPFDFFGFLRLIIKLSLFFKPIKIFMPLAAFLMLLAAAIPLLYIMGITQQFLDTTFIILSATALQTLFFGLLAEIVIHSK